MKYFLLAAAVLSIIFLGFYMGMNSFTMYETGTLIVKIKDPPKDWAESSNVLIHYSSIDIHRVGSDNQSGWYTAVKDGGWIDLREVLNVTKVIGSSSLHSGVYNLIRLEIIEGIVTVDGENHTAPIQSGKMTIAILHGGVAIQNWQTSSVVIDIMPKVVGSKDHGYKIVPAAKAYAES